MPYYSSLDSYEGLHMDVTYLNACCRLYDLPQLSAPCSVMMPDSSSDLARSQGMARTQQTLTNQSSEEITTAMVRNIPYQYSLEDVLAEFDDLGIGTSYNFVFLPSGDKKRPNLGYAFVNVVSPSKYDHFVKTLTQYRFKKRSKKSCKPASVKPAEIQGLHRNLAVARKTAHPDAFFLAEGSLLEVGSLCPGSVHVSDRLSL